MNVTIDEDSQPLSSRLSLVSNVTLCRSWWKLSRWRTVVGVWLLGIPWVPGCARVDAVRENPELVPEAERFGGAVVVGVPAEPERLNPLTVATAEGFDLLQLVFTPLLRTAADLERPEPGLVERWDTVRVAAESLQITLHLRDDVRWHDGRLVTAEDVVFTFDRLKDPRTAAPAAAELHHYAPRAEWVDSRTLRLRLRAYPAFLSPLAQLFPVPKHLLAQVPPERILYHPFGRDSVVGSGPFRFRRRVPGQQWVLEANTAYPAALGGRPYLDRLLLRVVPEPTARFTDLQTGGVDVMLAPAPAQAAQLERVPDVRRVAGPGSQVLSIHWNNRTPMFADARVRRALSLALDRQAIIDAVFQGQGTAGAGTARPIDWHFNPRVRAPYNPAAARALLAAAGWTDAGASGTRQDATGRPLEFTLIYPAAFAEYGEIATIAQAQLAAVGAQMQLRPLEMSSFVATVSGTLDQQGQRVRNFDASLHPFHFWGPVDDTPMLHSRHGNDMFGVTGFRNPRADTLLDQLSTEMDRSVLNRLWQQFQQMVLDEAPQTVIAYPARVLGVRNHVQGVQVDARGDFATAARWWVLPGRRF